MGLWHMVDCAILQSGLVIVLAAAGNEAVVVVLAVAIADSSQIVFFSDFSCAYSTV